MPTRPFNPGSEAQAATPFTFAGVKYAKGERFPYRDLKVIDFDLRGLWLAERIEFVDRPHAAAPGPQQPGTKPQQNQQHQQHQHNNHRR